MSQDILYEKANAENEFLTIINATFSHELRNPLQSIMSQGGMCVSQLIDVVENKANKSVKEVSKELREVVKMLRTSNSIQDSYARVMGFLIDNLIDFSQLNSG